MKSVTFEGAEAGGGKLCRLGVDARGALEVRAVDAARDRGFEASGKSPFRVTGLLPGGYDLFVKYDDRIRCAVTAPGELTEARRRNWTPASSGSRSSFDEKRVRGCFGGRDRAKVLPEMRRTKDNDRQGRQRRIVPPRPLGGLVAAQARDDQWVDARVFLFASA